MFSFPSSNVPPAYPRGLIESFELSGNAAILRPILPSDAQGEKELFAALSERNRQFRYHSSLKELDDQRIESATCVDYTLRLGLVITVRRNRRDHIVADGCYVAGGPGKPAEFALAVADAWAGQGCGRRLLAALDRAAARAGVPMLYGDVMFDNDRMIQLLLSLGFDLQPLPDGDVYRMQRCVSRYRAAAASPDWLRMFRKPATAAG